jgi:3-hydroxyisobutyrate dehydrogenase-like beta-hydroxyacid dehydrogenase
MISDDQALKEVAGAVRDGIKPGSIYIDMSTVSPAASAEVAAWMDKAGASYLRAPVSGSTMLASKGALTIFISGPSQALEKARPVLEQMGKTLHHVGKDEEARRLKLAINLMIGITAATMGEALAFGESGGIEWRQMIDIINASVVASPLTGYKAEMLKSRDFTPAFTASQMLKDFDLVLDTARNGNLPMPVTALVRQFWGAMIATGRGEKDFFSYVTMMEELAGITPQGVKKG